MLERLTDQLKAAEHAARSVADERQRAVQYAEAEKVGLTRLLHQEENTNKELQKEIEEVGVLGSVVCIFNWWHMFHVFFYCRSCTSSTIFQHASLSLSQYSITLDIFWGRKKCSFKSKGFCTGTGWTCCGDNTTGTSQRWGTCAAGESQAAGARPSQGWQRLQPPHPGHQNSNKWGQLSSVSNLQHSVALTCIRCTSW